MGQEDINTICLVISAVCLLVLAIKAL